MASEIEVARPGIVLRKRVARKPKRCAAEDVWGQPLQSLAPKRAEERHLQTKSFVRGEPRATTAGYIRKNT